MAYDEHLAQRIRDALSGDRRVVEKKMFGGIAFLVNGNMACGVVDQSLMVRFDKDRTEEILATPHVREMDFTGKTMRGFAFVDPPAIAEDADLAAWVDVGRGFAQSLPPK